MMDESEIDAALAAMSQSELRAHVKEAMAIINLALRACSTLTDQMQAIGAGWGGAMNEIDERARLLTERVQQRSN